MAEDARRYEPLFEHANDAIALVEFQDTTPIIKQANPKFREVFGPNEANLEGRDLDEIVASGERSEEARELSQRVRDGEVIRRSITRETAEGLRNFDWQVIPVDVPDIERADRAFTIYNDITERVEHERALEESEERYRQLLATAPTPILIYRHTGEIIYGNEAAVELLGAENREDIMGLTPEDFIHPESREQLEDRRHRLIEVREAVPPIEQRLLDLNGREKHVFVASSPVIYEGEPAIQTVATDVTELKNREEELERYETLVEISGDPMYMLDADGCFTYVNEALTDITGHSEEMLLDEHVRIVMDSKDVARGEELIQSLLSEGEQRGTFEMQLVTADGGRIPAENHLSILYENGEFKGSAGVLRDISDRIEREHRLQRERDRLEEFAGVVSHDIRNPLNVAKGRLEMAMMESESEHLEAVEGAIDRMETLIQDMLTLARAGDAVGETEAIELSALIETCWRNVETDSAEIVVDTGAAIRADRTRLQQLFENLFRNAVEHGGQNVEVTVGDLPSGFYVEDDGPGIPEDEIGKILEPGYTTSEEGTGFGLSIVRDIAEAHGWMLKVANGKDGGARFEFSRVRRV